MNPFPKVHGILFQQPHMSPPLRCGKWDTFRFGGLSIGYGDIVSACIAGIELSWSADAG